jgi:hypothetical protein
MQATHLADGLDPGTQIKMIGIAEQNLYAEIFENILRDPLDRPECSYRHEDGRLDLTVRSDESPRPSRPARGFNL